MKTASVSNQNFEGRVIGCSWLKPKQKKTFKQVRPCLENLIKNKDYDLKIYKSYGQELRIAAGENIDSGVPLDYEISITDAGGNIDLTPLYTFDFKSYFDSLGQQA